MYHQSVAGFDISHAGGRFQGQLDNMFGAKHKLDFINILRFFFTANRTSETFSVF